MASLFKLDELLLAECAAEVMVYVERHKLLELMTQMLVELSMLRPDNPKRWIGKNIARIADKIYRNCLEISYNGGGECRFYQQPRRFHHRVIIFGRRGSGRKSQALSLSRMFQLVYIDVDSLIQENLKSKTNLGKELQEAFIHENIPAKSRAVSAIIKNRLLQMDALHKGWVMVNYPNTLEEIKDVFEHFKVPPNKFVYLSCPSDVALKRIYAKPNLGCQQDKCSYMEKDFKFFNSQESEFMEYLTRRHEVICVDATPCFEAVRTQLLSKLEQVPYVMGFKIGL